MDQVVLPDRVDHAHGSGAITGFLGGLVLGTLVGAGLALISTPERGEEVRGQLRDVSLRVTDRVGAATGQARDQFGTLQGRAQGALGQAKERAKALTDHSGMPLPSADEGAASDQVTSVLLGENAVNASLQGGEA